MLFFNFKGRSFRIRFKDLVITQKDRCGQVGPFRCIEASIIQLERRGDSVLDRVVIRGGSQCHWKDQFDRIEGQKLALSRALRDLDALFGSKRFGRPFRTAAWKAFWKPIRERQLRRQIRKAEKFIERSRRLLAEDSESAISLIAG